MNNFDYSYYFKTEYNEADREYYMNSICAKRKINYLKKIKDVLLGCKVMVISPGDETYSYFLNEYKNDISFEHNNIIIPTESIKTLR